MPVSCSPRPKPRSILGGRAGMVRDLVIVAICMALMAAFLSQLWAARAPHPPAGTPPSAAASRAP